MQNKLFGFLVAAAVTVISAAPLSAQSIRLTASIPFEFTVGNATMPAITNNWFIAGNGVSDNVGAIRLSGVFSNGVITLIGDARLPTAQRRTVTNVEKFNKPGGVPFSSGLLGPVSVWSCP